MLNFGNKEFRNLQEQVFKNMRDIENLNQGAVVLDEFGIKVIGQVDTVMEMPTVADYKENNPDWEYGDAYAVGTEAPYTLYILTRENETHAEDFWFDIGDFPAPGPQGPQGPQGETGPQGQTGNPGQDGASAGFGVVSASATTLTPGSDATVSVVASGPDTEKSFSFTFGIPEGQPGQDGASEWGEISGDLSDQTDLVNALQAKQNTLVSGTNIKTINNTSILGSGNIDIQSAVWGNITGTLADQTDLQSALDNKVTLDTTQTITGAKTFDQSVVIQNKRLSGVSDVVQIYPVSGGKVGMRVGDPSMHFGSAAVYSDGTVVCTADDYGINANLQFPEKGTVASPETIAVVSDIPTAVSELTNDSGYITGVAWGDITGTLSNQTDLVSALQTKQNLLVSGTNIKTINNESILGSGNIVIQGGGGDVTDVEVNGVSVVNQDGVAEVTVPTKVSDLTNDSGFITGIAWGQITGTLSNQTDLNTALSGKQDTISDLSTIRDGAAAGATAVQPAAISDMATETWVGQQGYLTSVSWSDVSNKPTFATVATSGDYDDLINKPTIPAAQVNSDWNASSGVAQILNKPTLATVATTGAYSDLLGTPDLSVYALSSSLATVATSGSYNDLSNKPTIPVVDYPVTDVQVDGVSVVSNKVASITLPNLNNYVTLDGAQTITGKKTFISQSVDEVIAFGNSFGEGGYIFAGRSSSSTGQPSISLRSSLGGSGSLFQYQSMILLKSGSSNSFEPSYPSIELDGKILTNTDNKWAIGSNINRFKDLYLAGNLSDGTNSIAIADIASKSEIPSLTNYYTKTDVDEIVDNVAADIPTNTSDLINDSGFISGITSSMVTTALGYTPIASVTPTTETWTFTLSDGTTTTKTIVTAVTSA